MLLGALLVCLAAATEVVWLSPPSDAERTRVALSQLDMAGVTAPQVREGTMGAHARSLGAAAIPLSQRYLIDWNAAAKFATLNTLIAAEIANAPAAPRWFADSFFGAEFAPEAAKAKR